MDNLQNFSIFAVCKREYSSFVYEAQTYCTGTNLARSFEALQFVRGNTRISVYEEFYYVTSKVLEPYVL